MSEEVSKAVWPWVAPALSVGLALAAFWLAWRYGWPWGAFLLAEGLALAALAVALWRTDEGYPWWAYPALFVGVVILFFSWLYLDNRLKLAEAIQAGSAVVLTFFTITLWRSTQAQAEVTNEMKALQERLSRAELTPLIVVDLAECFSWASLQQLINNNIDAGTKMELNKNYCFLVVRIFNAGKYPAVGLKAKAKTGSHAWIDAGGSFDSLDKSLKSLMASSKIPEKFEPRILEPIKAGWFIFSCDRNKLGGEGTEVVLTVEFIYGGAPGEKQAKEWRARIKNTSSPDLCPSLGPVIART